MKRPSSGISARAGLLWPEAITRRTWGHRLAPSLGAPKIAARSSGALCPVLTGAVFLACWALKTGGHDLDHARRLRGDRVDTAKGLNRRGAPGRRRGLSRHA